MSLRVVEIGRNCDHGLLDIFAKIRFCILFHFLQDERTNLARRVLISATLDPGVAIFTFDDAVRHQVHIFLGLVVTEAPTDKSLDREKRIFRIGDGLPFCRMPDKSFIRFRKGDHRGCSAEAFRTFNHFGLRPFHNGDARICRTQIDTNYFAHLLDLFSSNRSARSTGPKNGPGP